MRISDWSSDVCSSDLRGSSVVRRCFGGFGWLLRLRCQADRNSMLPDSEVLAFQNEQRAPIVAGQFLQPCLICTGDSERKMIPGTCHPYVQQSRPFKLLCFDGSLPFRAPRGRDVKEYVLRLRPVRPRPVSESPGGQRRTPVRRLLILGDQSEGRALNLGIQLREDHHPPLQALCAVVG